MKDTLVLNDWHLSVKRVAGTTYETVLALRRKLQQELRHVLMEHVDVNVVILGDLYDQYISDLEDVLTFYHTAMDWLPDSSDDVVLYLVTGNHDLSKESEVISSLEFLYVVLQASYPDRVVLINKPGMINDNTYIIPHMIDQKAFDKAVKEVPDDGKEADTLSRYLLAHCNYDNPFAGEKDHSLNLSQTQAKGLRGKGYAVCLGHEHKARSASLPVMIFGNQYPSSVVDCTNVVEKFCHILRPDGTLDVISTWVASESYIEIDWKDDLNNAKDYEFIRVMGEATPEQAPVVVDRIGKLRQNSDAFIVGNAVRIEGVDISADVLNTVETIETFDILAFLFDNLKEDQVQVVKDLLEKAHD